MILKFMSFGLWFLASSTTFSLTTVSSLQWLLGALLLGLGQTLNAGIFKAIGVKGVYYGTRLGEHVPRVTGFPFNITSHPQYVGNLLSYLGISSILYSPGHEGFLSLLLISIVLYGFTSYLETYH